jgi:hypothetical protein
MRYGKLFLLDRGKIVIVRDAAGVQVSFATIEAFNLYYPGLDLIGKTYINYEPERAPIPTYIDDSDPEISAADIPEQKYEAVISAVADMTAKKADPYYGMDVDSAKALRIKEVRAEGMADIFLQWPIWKQLNANAGIYDETVKAEKDAYVTKIIDAIAAAEANMRVRKPWAILKK